MAVSTSPASQSAGLVRLTSLRATGIGDKRVVLACDLIDDKLPARHSAGLVRLTSLRVTEAVDNRVVLVNGLCLHHAIFWL